MFHAIFSLKALFYFYGTCRGFQFLGKRRIKTKNICKSLLFALIIQNNLLQTIDKLQKKTYSIEIEKKYI